MEKQVLEIAAEVFNADWHSLDLDAMREATPQWDSFAHVALVTLIEDRLGVVIPIEKVADIRRLRDFLTEFRRA